MSKFKEWNHKKSTAVDYASQEIGDQRLVPYVESDIYEYCKSRFLVSRIESKQPVYLKEVRVLKTPGVLDTIVNFLSESSDPTVTQMSSRYTFVENESLLIKVVSTNLLTRVEILGNKSESDLLNDIIEAAFDVVNTSINWITNADMHQVTIPLIKPRGIMDSSYPFINGVEKFVDDFISSSANVLLLIGPPGTGKSNFLKHIVSKSGQDAMVTFDPEIAGKDILYGEFIDSDSAFLIFEDAEILLQGTREDGNKYMHRFLNSSDGLVSSKNKKLIFSTNLSSVDEIDPALLRSGRCFAVVTFRALTSAESLTFLSDHDMITEENFIDSNRSYTLAELYSLNQKQYSKKQKKTSAGFY
jgi:hypothetical protein